MEAAVWFVSPLIFVGATSWFFWLMTRVKMIWPFVGTAALSMLAYLFIKPTCGCIGIDQIFGALVLAASFNFAIFLCVFIVAFVLVKAKRITR
jgi:hypothetical protein